MSSVFQFPVAIVAIVIVVIINNMHLLYCMHTKFSRSPFLLPNKNHDSMSYY